jgi:hypothetical protein
VLQPADLHARSSLLTHEDQVENSKAEMLVVDRHEHGYGGFTRTVPSEESASILPSAKLLPESTQSMRVRTAIVIMCRRVKLPQQKQTRKFLPWLAHVDVIMLATIESTVFLLRQP